MTFPALQIGAVAETSFAPVLNDDDEVRALRSELDELRRRLGPGQSWTPALTASTTDPGTSTVEGWRHRIGNLQLLWGRVVLSSGGSGTYAVALPVDAVGLTGGSTHGSVIGSGMIVDDGTAANRQPVTPFLTGPASIRFMVADGGFLSSTNPFTMASADSLSFHLAYPVAGEAT